MYKRYLPIVIVGILFFIAIKPVYASPSLSLGSTASYGLTGNVQTSQTCIASPAIYTPQACYGAYTTSPETVYVSILDDNQCTFYYNYSYPALCRFVPSALTLTQGSTVIWTNNGNLAHSVTSNQTVNGAPMFNSTLPSRAMSSFTFAEVGTFAYYDSIHGQSGVVNITPPYSSIGNQPPTSFQLGFTGSLGWKIVGLSSSQANLLISHNIALTVSPSGIPISFTPVTESGSIEQSVNLSIRVESPGTASSLVMTVLSTYLQGILRGYGGYQLPVGDPSTEPSYTQWWVSGPLANGSPVQILQGWSSVTGSSGLDLGGSIGTRQAWIVTSNLDQTFNLNIPNVNSPLGPSSTSTAKAKIGFQWSFDKSTDLLLKNNDTISFSTLSVAPSAVYLGTGPVDVSVTRTMSATVTLTIQLSSTSLNLNGGQQTPALNPLSPMSWMSVGLVGLAAGVVSGALLWQGYRTRRSAAPITSPTSPTPY